MQRILYVDVAVARLLFIYFFELNWPHPHRMAYLYWIYNHLVLFLFLARVKSKLVVVPQLLQLLVLRPLLQPHLRRVHDSRLYRPFECLLWRGSRSSQLAVWSSIVHPRKFGNCELWVKTSLRQLVCQLPAKIIISSCKLTWGELSLSRHRVFKKDSSVPSSA